MQCGQQPFCHKITHDQRWKPSDHLQDLANAGRLRSNPHVNKLGMGSVDHVLALTAFTEIP